MSRPLRILHVFRSPVGGLFRHVQDVARGQVERGHAVGLFCDTSTGGERADAVLSELAPSLALGLHRVPMARQMHPRDVAALASLTGLYARTRPDVLHGHGAKGGAFARLATVPTLDGRTIRAYTPHGGSFNYAPGTLPHRAYMTAERIFTARTDVLLFESASVKSRFDASIGKTGADVRVVHNGLSDAEFEPVQLKPDPFDILFIGEIRQAKGIDTLVDALALIRRQEGIRLTALFVGAGPSEADLLERARQAGVYDSIALVPPQPIRGAMERARIMVMPSLAESLPYVILEAAAAAQPLIATKVGGIPEIFGPFSDRLVPPGDPVVLAAHILAKHRQGVDERRQDAEALRAHVRDRFSMARMVDGVLDGYAAAQAARAARSR